MKYATLLLSCFIAASKFGCDQLSQYVESGDQVGVLDREDLALDWVVYEKDELYLTSVSKYQQSKKTFSPHNR